MTNADLELIECVPDSWLDSLLSGPTAVIGRGPYSGDDIERLCKAIRERMRGVIADRTAPCCCESDAPAGWNNQCPRHGSTARSGRQDGSE